MALFRLSIVLMLAFGGVAVAQESGTGPVDIVLAGTVREYDGNPVKDAFVMLKGSPRLCAVTDALGQFRIQGKAHSLPDVLLVSRAGCKTAEIPVAKSNAKGLSIQLEAEDREYTKIEVGAAITVTRRGAARKLPSLYKRFSDGPRRLTPDEQSCVDAYEVFLKEKGEAIIQKIIVGDELSADEAKYRYLFHAEISARAGYEAFGKAKDSDHEYRVYARNVIQRGNDAMLKGYTGKPLNADDIEAMRLYRAVQAVYAPATGKIHPNSLYHSDQCVKYPDVGGKILDFTFLDFDSMLKSPAYSDYSSLSLTKFVRLESLADLFARFASHAIDENGSVIPAQPATLRSRYYHDYERLVTIADILADADGKPTILSWICWEDRTYPAPTAWFTEYLRKAYFGYGRLVGAEFVLWRLLPRVSPTPARRTLHPRLHRQRW